MANPNALERWFGRVDTSLDEIDASPEWRQFLQSSFYRTVISLLVVAVVLLSICVGWVLGLDKRATAFVLALILFLVLPIVGLVLYARFAIRMANTPVTSASAGSASRKVT